MVKTAEPSDRGDATDDLHGSMKQNILVPRKMRQPVLVLATKVSHSNLHDGNRELLLLLHQKAPLLPSAAGCPALCAGRSATARDQRRDADDDMASANAPASEHLKRIFGMTFSPLCYPVRQRRSA
jgi:hypothetical protein